MTSSYGEEVLAYFAKHAIDPKVAAEVGVLERAGELIYPYSDDDGSYERVRALTPGPAKVRQPLGRPLVCWWPTGRPAQLGAVLVAEGESDALAALSAIRREQSHPAAKAILEGLSVCAVPGASFPADRLAEALQGAEAAILAGDGDEAGQAFVRRASKALEGGNIGVAQIELGSGSDLADALAAAGDAGGWLAGVIADATVEPIGSVPDDGKPRIRSVTAAEVEPLQVDWLLRERIPLGELTVVGGSPGRGKTTYATGLSAELTRGKLDGELLGAPADVAFVSCEDSIERTLIPRFLAAGGDPHRAHFFQAKGVADDTDGDDPVLELPADTPIIREWLTRTRARLLVLDPVIAMIPAALSGHKDQHVRRALAPLSRVAQELGVAVICLMHLTKDREADALNRLNGSVAFGAAARSVLLLAEDPDDPEGENGSRRVLAHVKSNLGAKQPSVNYIVESRMVEGAAGPVGTSILVEQGESTYTANDLLDKTASSTEANARDEARTFLADELADGPLPTNALKSSAEDAGIAWRTIERAKQSLGVKASKAATGWEWSLAPRAYASPPGGLGGLGGLPTDSGVSTPPTPPTPPPPMASEGGGLDDELARVAAKFGDEVIA
jgi:putative DNA primase/helicase